ncbi:Aste57867_16037 [Aphanomyces stellatus]|uniref:Aste57867_16037 protein n=1 Tax=Aphanomyces stellatus TaxID=120398 RepID=A0A485L4K8_9STRA|nr:hypothetical protein As57867_015981 [Aphanomyces stellatus]VFT92821.1 Aste57867_16037 [Aphanomyces stellatus]
MPVLSPRHIQLIKANWAAVCQGTSAFDATKDGSPDKFFHRTFYALLFNAEPSLRAIFRSSLTMQGKSLASIIKVMTSVMSASNIVERMQALATGHLKFGVRREDYATMGVTLIKTLEIISGNGWSRDIRDAYMTAYCLLFYLLLPVVANYAPDPMQDSIACAITNVEVVTTHARRVSLAYDFPLRFQPGDGILLGAGNTKVCFPIASFHDKPTSALDIVVDLTTSDWLCRQAMCGKLKLYWVTSNVNFEIDTPESLPPHVLMVSHGLGAAPFAAMLRGLQSVQDAYKGKVTALACGATPEDVEPFFNDETKRGNEPSLREWDRCDIQYAPTVTAEKLRTMVPNTIDKVELFVNGPKDFVAMAEKAYFAAGGTKPIRVYSFDNPRMNR